jgi:glycosyltransferase involved in cell wall biosynthesis
VKLLIVGGSPAHPGGVEAFCARAREALEMAGHTGIDIIPARSAFLRVRRLHDFARGLLAAYTRYRDDRPDLVWVQYTNLPDLMHLLVAKWAGMTVAVTPHLGSNWKSQSDRRWRALSGWMLKRADRLGLISKTQELEINLPPKVPRSYIRNFLPRRMWSVPLADCSTAKGPELRLVHAGRLSAGKGTFLFVDVCRRLAEMGVPFIARISGSADEATMTRLKATITDAGLADRIEILGWISEAALLTLLQESDVLVHLSTIDSYPLVVMEAIAYCMFPVCLNLAGATDIVTTYDGHVVPEDGAVDAIAQFLANHSPDELRSRARAAAPRLRADYDWQVCVAALEDMFSKTIAGRRR